MPKHKRDEFSQKTRDTLRLRVANSCSNPECKILSLEPQKSNSSKVSDTGAAAHICAAAPGGPRYDPTMTAEARKSIDNAIWLCRHCSIKIDNDPVAYPIELLHQWKRNAEFRISKNSNKMFYTHEESEYKVQRSFLTSIGMNINEKFNYSLSEISKSINKYFNDLDPRLDIKYSHLEGLDHFKISTTGSSIDNPVLINFSPENTHEYKEKYNEFLEHGKSFTFNISTITSNSEGLNILFPPNLKDGFVTVNQENKLKAFVEILDSNDNNIIDFEDFIRIGKSSFSFNSSKFEGLLSLKIDKAPLHKRSQRKDTTLFLDYKIWDNQNILSLKYFDQIYKIYKRIIDKSEFYLKIYINGSIAYSTKYEFKDENLRSLFSLLSYTYHSRILSEILDLNINFTSECPFTSDEHQAIYDTILAIENKNTNEGFTCSYIIKSYDYVPLEKISSGESVSLINECTVNISNIFGVSIKQKVFVQYEFFNVETNVNYEMDDDFHKYIFKFNNLNKNGTMKRTTGLKNPEKKYNLRQNYVDKKAT
jgi:hypothetical protein